MPEGISEEVLSDLANKALVGTILVIILQFVLQIALKGTMELYLSFYLYL